MVEPTSNLSFGGSGPAVCGANDSRICTTILFGIGAYAGLIAVASSVLMRILPSSPAIAPVQITLLYGVMCMHGAVAAAALLAGLAFRRQQQSGTLAARLMLVLAIVFGFVSLDQVIGVVYPPPDRLDTVVQPHPTRGWSLRPGAIGTYGEMEVRINSLGLRDREFPVRKPEDEFRVLFVGDSIAAGVGLPVEDTFIRQIEPLLNRVSAGRYIRTINAGFIGYTTWQETAYLREEGLRLSPDLVVLCFCVNDVVDVMDAPPRMLRGKPWVTEYPPLNHVSGFVRMAARIHDVRRAKIIQEHHLWTHQNIYGVPRDEWVNVEDMYEDPPSARLNAAWERTFEDLTEFDELCRENDLPWVLLSFPVAFNLPADAAARKITQRLQDWAEGREVAALDVTSAFERWMSENQADSSALFVDGIHPNAVGSRVIAETLHGFLTQRGLAPGVKSKRQKVETPKIQNAEASK